MPDVDLVATTDFSYSTRRLKAGDSFTVPAKMAKVLIGIKKAELPRVVGKVSPPPPEVVEKVAEAAPVKEETTVPAHTSAPKKVPAMSTKTAAAKLRRTTRKSAAKKS